MFDVKALLELPSEQINSATQDLDSWDALRIVQAMNQADQQVPQAIAAYLPQIAAAVDIISARLQQGGRLIYCGAGTSGRLGVLDAAECPPTFNTAPEQVIGLIAGGEAAMFRAQEGAEDNAQAGQHDLVAIGLGANDVVVGLAASGRTPYVQGALHYAQQQGAATVSISTNANGSIHQVADINISPAVGAEVLTGSTRLKAGTMQKLVLNMLSTASMIRLGKSYGNLMVDLRASNQKLVVRSRRILMAVTDLDETQAEQALQQAKGNLKQAIVMQLCQCSQLEAQQALTQHNGHVRLALQALQQR